MIHPSGTVPIFNKDKHKFTINGKESISVTQLIKRFFPKFNKYQVSKKYAEKHGLSQEEVLKLWETKSSNSRNIGDRCHAYASNFIKCLCNIDKKKYIKPYDVRYGIIVDKLFELLDKRTYVGSESTIFSLKFNLAGTVDLIMFTTDHIYLYDWKFTESVKMNNPWKNCHAPIQHLDASDFNKHSLQLNLYQFILETEKYFNMDMEYKKSILHVTETDCVEIEVPDMKKEIKAILIEREIQNGESNKA